MLEGEGRRACMRSTVVAALVTAMVAGCSAARGPAARRASDVVVKLHPVTEKGVGDLNVGSATLIPASERSVGVSILMVHLTKGNHYVEFHQGGSCEPAAVGGKRIAAGAAGPVFAPKGMTFVQSDNTPAAFDSHRPSLQADADGEGGVQLTLHGISLTELAGRTLVVLGQGDYVVDQDPALAVVQGPVACGVIPQR